MIKIYCLILNFISENFIRFILPREKEKLLSSRSILNSRDVKRIACRNNEKSGFIDLLMYLIITDKNPSTPSH